MMIKSMTGYGRAESILNGRKYTVEIKSLNHRYLEVSVRLPAVLSLLEIEIKKKISERFSRGRIEVSARLESENKQEGEIRCELNLPLIREYYESLVRLKDELNLEEKITLSMLTGFKDVFVLTESRLDVTSVWQDLQAVLEDAVNALALMREREGETLYRDLILRMELIENSLEAIAERAPQVVLEYRKRLSERVKDITGGIALDEIRLVQEVAVMAEKSDITEETVRLKSHINQYKDLLGSGNAVGRNIDFLIQEMVREVNTIGSKSADSEISRRIVEIKGELAKIREQVQNVE